MFSTSSVVYSVSCFYTSKDVNFKKVISVFSKVWGRLLVTILLFTFIMGIYIFVTLGSLVLFVSREFGPEGEGAYKVLVFLVCISIPSFIAYVYITIVWNIAMVISVLEKDYWVKALVRSMKLIKGKIWVSSAIFVALETIFTGLMIAFSLLVLDGKILNLVGNIFVGIVCYLLAAFMLHFSLVIQTVIYFVCKAKHNEDISNVAAHLDSHLPNPHPFVLFVVNFYGSLYYFLFLYLERYQLQEICTILYLGLLYWFVATFDGPDYKAFSIIIAFTTPYLSVFVYTAIVWNMAMVISVLEKDYGIKALVESMKLIYGKIWVSSAVFVVLEIIFAGTIIAFSLLVLNRNILNLVGNIFVGIACYLLLPVLFHFSLVLQAITYFVCKAYHNEDISNIAAHLDISYVTLGRRNEEV
ncbi:hypothetical protein C5167_008185 [Papaver somniferum]|uniref:Uncharacterized protein n=1 Tax=Papaver somniferum TaxID=3469 RepID=A0A4Y7JTT3_PAPSO|nr:hypothetical protein C5167_008185 [Papaver somniferum]